MAIRSLAVFDAAMILLLLAWCVGSDPEVVAITLALALALTVAFRAIRHLIKQLHRKETA